MRFNNKLFNALLIVAVIGAINWGLIGLFNWNLVDAIFGGGAHEETSAASRVLYALVGLAGLGALLMLPQKDRHLTATHHHADAATHV